jgi:uncharacterized coiled-coil protein SlyX
VVLCYQNTGKRSKRPLFLSLSGYIFSLVIYLIWYFKLPHFSPYGKNIIDGPNIEIVVVGITALYLFLFLLILSIRPFQTTWKSFFLVSTLILLTFVLIPSVIKIYTEKKRMEKLDVKIDAANKSISELIAKLESERKENGELREQLNEIIKKWKSLNEIHKTKGDIVIQAKSNKDFSKINFEADNADLNIKNQEVIFKAQIISSNAHLAKNSPKFKDLKNIWEYKDSGLYKYNEFCKLDLPSSQKR